jgi:hypothetical protein
MCAALYSLEEDCTLYCMCAALYSLEEDCTLYCNCAALYSLEEDWTEMVEAEGLGEKARSQQTAIWELITTELAYIRTLKVIQDVST